MIKPYVPSDESNMLREHLLTTEMLKHLQRLHPGAIRVLSVLRENARVSVNDKVFLEFDILVLNNGSEYLLEVGGYSGSKTLPESLWELARHEAAEAMLAVRQGHRDSQRRRAEKKEKALSEDS
jgi:hypothetical protein